MKKQNKKRGENILRAGKKRQKQKLACNADSMHKYICPHIHIYTPKHLHTIGDFTVPQTWIYPHLSQKRTFFLTLARILRCIVRISGRITKTHKNI
jgi:hypothetical protein